MMARKVTKSVTAAVAVSFVVLVVAFSLKAFINNISNLQQLRTDGVTVIPEGGQIPSPGNLFLRGTAPSSDYYMAAEVKNINTGAIYRYMQYPPYGSATATIQIYGLPVGYYTWHANGHYRTDSTPYNDPWTEFGAGSSEIDFIVGAPSVEYPYVKTGTEVEPLPQPSTGVTGGSSEGGTTHVGGGHAGGGDGTAVTPTGGPTVPEPQDEKTAVTPQGIIPALGCGIGNANGWTSTVNSVAYTVGEPVIAHSGEFQRSETDLTIPGRGVSIDFTRVYRSQITYTGPVGYNWDHNYNIRLKTIDSTSVAIYNGFGRKETYTGYNAGTGEYISPLGYYHTLKKNGNGTYTLTERNGIKTNFSAAGLMTSIVERNGNTLTFEYDGQNRLKYIKDPLFVGGASPERKVELFYHSNNFLQKIKDWKGREVLYTYYGSNETGGNPWDLKSVAYPATPDNPSGTTVSYTYSKGNADGKLNHNLLTITNPNQQPSGTPVLTNVYNTSDKVTSQTYGNGTYTFSYQTGYTEETDRNGNVRRVYFNKDGIAGTADDAATWKVEQFTRGIRPGDPASFVTLFDQNAQGNSTKITFPRGNSLTITYDESNADPLARGNVLQIRRSDEALGNDPDIVTTFTYYASSLFNLVHTIADPKNNVTTFEYDVKGNLTKLTAPSPTTYDANGNPTGNQTVESTFAYNGSGQVTSSVSPMGKVSSFAYYPSGNQNYGYLQQVTVDSGGTNLTASFAYDTVGNLTSITDGRGNVTTFEYNNLDQLTKTTSASPFGYIKEYHYDANGNMVRMDIQNVNASNIPAKTISQENENMPDVANPVITHTYAFDILNRLTSSAREISPTESAVTAYLYDNSGNIVQLTQPEGNIVKLEYDERDLIYRATRGFGAVEASATTSNYDPNGNLVQQIDGLGHSATSLYDGFDRLQRITDAQGNYTLLTPDANGNVVTIENFNASALRLTKKELFYDELDRNYRSLRHLLDGGGNTVGTVKGAYFFDPNSRITRIEDDNSHGVDYLYDGANRLIRVTDALGNIQDYTYDGNSNLTQRVSDELDPETSQRQQYVSEYLYDVLNRVKQTNYRSQDSSIVITSRMNHDSRNNVTFTLDAEGNTITHEYDGINRHTRTIRDLRTGGVVTSSINTSATYDRNSRLTATADHNGNTTNYIYDALDRRIRQTYPDGKFNTITFDANDNITRTVDPNGTAVDLTYDTLDRLTAKAIARAPGVLGTTSESFTYDGLSRLTSASNDDSTVSMTYDSLSRVSSTTQNGKTISRLFDGVGNRLQLNYPGGRQVAYEPDELDRIKNIRSGASTIASYKYIGVGRVKERSYLNGTNLAVQYDGVKRVADYANALGAVTISQYQYSYDNMFNKLFEKRLHHNKRDDYVYDSLYRMTEYRKDGDLNGNSPAKTIGYTLDGVGNRTQTTENGTPTTYSVNNLNQYTAVGGVAQTHDDNGNLTSDGTRTFAYDYADRLVRIVTATQTIDYKYDVFGRRIEKSVNGVVAVRYYYEGDRVIEDRDGTDGTTATYVFGNGIDEILTMDRGGQTYYFHTNAQGSITEVTDSTGAIVERYEYDAYGAITIFTAPGVDGVWHTADDVVSASSAIGNRYTFTGREWEQESGLYYYRARFYDPVTGRFLQRDPAGEDDLENLYAYVNNSPAVYVDPMGWNIFDDIGSFLKGAYNTAREPFAAIGDVIIVTPYAALKGWKSDTIVYSSASANSTQEKLKSGVDPTLAAVTGVRDACATIATLGVYGAIKTEAEAIDAFKKGLITEEELRSIMFEVAGGLSFMAASSKVMAMRSTSAAKFLATESVASKSANPSIWEFAMKPWKLLKKPTGGVAESVRGGIAEGILGATRGRSGLSSQAEITKVLSGLRGKGRVKFVGSEAELRSLYGRLSAGGKNVTPSTYRGTMVELPDGTRVGLREVSSSTPGLPTIDVKTPTGQQWKVHIK